MEFVRKSMGKWIEAAIILVVGILCIVAGAQIGNGDASEDTWKAIGMTVSIALIVVGSIGILGAIFAAIFSKKGIAETGTGSAIVLAMGIWLLVEVYSTADIIGLIISFVPYLMLCVGGVVVLDAIAIIIEGIKEKNVKHALAASIVGIIEGAAAIVLGALCIAKNGNGETIIPWNVQLIIFGVILALYGCFMALATFVTIPAVAVVAVTDTAKAQAVDAKSDDGSDHKA